MRLFGISFIIGGILGGLVFGALFPRTVPNNQLEANSLLVGQTQTEHEAAQKQIAYSNPVYPQVESYNVPILMYHYIRDYKKESDVIGTNLSISPKNFNKQLDYLAANGYQTVTFKDLANQHLPAKPIILTFDDGYEDAYTKAYPLLKQHNMRGVFFVISGFSNKRDGYTNWNQLSEMANNGMELGGHSIHHLDLEKLSFTEQEHEIVESVKTIQENTGAKITVFAYPSGKYNSTSTEIIEKSGLLFAVTTKPGVANKQSLRFELPRLRIENTTDVASLLNGTLAPQLLPISD